MKTIPVLSPVDSGRREPDPASASLTYTFIPYQPPPDLEASGLFLGVLYSFLIMGCFAGIGYGAYWLLQKVVEWL